MIEPTVAGREQRLNAALADYFSEVEAGRRPDRDAFLARYPDLAEDLASFFADKERFDRAAGPLGVSDPADRDAGRVRYVGDYELVGEIARGGMGVVYRAHQTSLGREVAVKMILAGHLATPAEVQRFKAEARAAAGLDHPNIVPIYEVGEWRPGVVGPALHYFSMKLIEGGNLAQQLPRFVQDPRAAAKLLAAVARAVHHAHEKGVLHRDLKPANVLIDRNGQPYVTDFGLSRRGGGGETQTGAVLGTPSYMAPEQAAGDVRNLTTAADVYSLGAILYECLTGRPPFLAATPLETLYRVKQEEPQPPRALNPNAPPQLETISLTCLQKDPRQRYSTAAALADDLERWLANEPIRARPIPAWRRGASWARGQPVLLGCLLGVLAVVGTVALAGVLVFVVMALLYGSLAEPPVAATTPKGMTAPATMKDTGTTGIGKAPLPPRFADRISPVPGMNAEWDLDGFRNYANFTVSEGKYDAEKGQMVFRLKAAADGAFPRAVLQLWARFLDRDGNELTVVDPERPQGENKALQLGDEITTALKLPGEEIRKKTARVVFELK